MKDSDKLSIFAAAAALTVMGSLGLLISVHPLWAQAGQAATGQISGHIYRADTGAPLSNAVVEILGQGAVSRRSASDGSYAFDVAPGQYYHVVAYKSGFVPRMTGDISIRAGQRRDGIDVRLPADPPIETLVDGPIASTYPNHKYWIAQVLFSPDAAILAVVTTSTQTAPNGPEEVWLYDMRSHQCVPVPLPVNGYGPHPTDIVWSADDTLYVRVGNYDMTGHPLPVRFAATMAGTKEIGQFPSDVEAAFALAARLGLDVAQSAFEGGEPSGPEKCSPIIERNSQFVVTLQADAPGCKWPTDLEMRKSDGSGAHQIGNVSSNSGPDFYFFLDKGRSVVIYATDPGAYLAGGFVTFDLNTLRSRVTAIPVRGRLLAEASAATGFLVAYYVPGICEPDESMTRAEYGAQPLWQLCIARIP